MTNSPAGGGFVTPAAGGAGDGILPYLPPDIARPWTRCGMSRGRSIGGSTAVALILQLTAQED